MIGTVVTRFVSWILFVTSWNAMYPVSGRPRDAAMAKPARKIAGNPACSQSFEESASSLVTTATIFDGSVWASRIIERQRDVCTEGMSPRQLGKVTEASLLAPFE